LGLSKKGGDVLRTGDIFLNSILGCAAVLMALSPSGSAQAGGTKVIYSFQGGADGALAVGDLIEDAAGNFYGTTQVGGASDDGTIFKVSPDGTETVLHAFSGGADGADPTSGLIADNSGNFYGVTEGDAVSNYGTVFKLLPDGTLTTLHIFNGNPDGDGPHGRLLADKEGNLYGTTEYGGAHSSGAVYKLAPDNTETVLYSFTGGADGALPVSGLIADKAGNLYGTAISGGIGECALHGCGVVFEVTPGGSETVLYHFTGGTDGSGPGEALIADGKGNLYGTTGYGGNTGCNAQGCGVVFRLTKAGVETVLYTFTGGSDGAHPFSRLIANWKGHLYGTTESGGVGGYGVVFTLSPNGSEKVLCNFSEALGTYPSDNLMAAQDGTLVGTTYGGGTKGDGTVFRLKE
jgi:uncharacterized repeat protein (TIGR03803 family)